MRGNWNDLMKVLPFVAFQELGNTHMVPLRLKPKIELLRTCYGHNAVERDFREWCQENREAQHKYPIIEYLKVIDSRLGSAPAEAQADLRDPNIEVIAALAYEYTGTLAPKRAIAELLLVYPVDEVRGALIEYAEHLTEKETPGAMRRFFSDGGAAAVILTRRKRAEHGL